MASTPSHAARSLDGFWVSKELSEVLFIQKDYYTVYQLTGSSTLIRERGVVYDLQQRATALSRDVANELSITFDGELFPILYQRAKSDVVQRLKSRSVLEPARSAVLDPQLNTSIFLDILSIGLLRVMQALSNRRTITFLKIFPRGVFIQRNCFKDYAQFLRIWATISDP